MLYQNRQVRIYSYQQSAPIIQPLSSRKAQHSFYQPHVGGSAQRLQKPTTASAINAKSGLSNDRIKQLFNRINEMTSKIEDLKVNTIKLQRTLEDSPSRPPRSFNQMVESFHRNMKQTYEGTRDDLGRPHGEGTLFGQDSALIYNGTWSHGVFEGRGKLLFDASVPYDGIGINSFRDQSRVNNNKVSYTGQFSNGAMTGLGQMLFKNDDQRRFIYYGRFTNGLFDGNGVVVEMFGVEQQLEGRWVMGIFQRNL